MSLIYKNLLACILNIILVSILILYQEICSLNPGKYLIVIIITFLIYHSFHFMIYSEINKLLLRFMGN